MPAPQITITEESLSRHPRLKLFLESSPPDVSLLSTDRYNTIYEDPRITIYLCLDSPTLFDVLSLYGKTSHIEALLLSPDEEKAAVMARNYLAILYAAKNGHLTTIEYLETHLTDAEKKAAVMAHDYLAIQEAARNHYVDTVHHFLRHAQALNYLEKHDHEYGAKFTYPYVDGVIKTLKADKAREPNGIFNVDDERAKHCFYLLRNLIRRGGAREGHVAEQLEEGVQFLLSIPAVRALCHQAVTVDEDSPGEVNELLKLAINNRNTAAEAILMRLPKESSSSLSNINMQVLGGFMAALGCAAVATAFVLLNAATFGIPGLIVAGLGAVLSVVGLFAASTYENKQEKPKESFVDASSLPVIELNSSHS
jgi:hypothetical protein